MGILCEPDGIELTLISKPYTPEDAAFMSAWIKAHKKKVAAAKKRKVKRVAKKKLIGFELIVRVNEYAGNFNSGGSTHPFDRGCEYGGAPRDGGLAGHA